MKAEANFFKQLFTTKNYLIEKFAALFPHISQIFAALKPHFSPNLPHIKQFKESAALHYLQNFAALYLCLWTGVVHVQRLRETTRYFKYFNFLFIV